VRAQLRIVLLLLLLMPGLLCVSPIRAQQMPALVGYWELIEQSHDLTIEFKANGVYIALTPKGVMSGRWEINEDKQLSTWSSDNSPRKVSQFAIEKGLLVITHSSGQKLVHRRITIM